MFKPTSLTPDLSKAARRELGHSQNDVIKATGIQAYRLKQWEARGLSIELTDLKMLCEFYAGQGVELDELAQHIGQVQGPPAPSGSDKLPEGITRTPRPGLLFSERLAAEEVDRLMERVETNDDRIGALVKAKIERGGFGGDITEESQQQVQELFGAMAENYLIYRLLQGRNIIEASRPTKEARTVGEFVSQWMQESPVAPEFATIEDGAPVGQE
jgi:transcriptional regulator with XRE-family HTH domain